MPMSKELTALENIESVLNEEESIMFGIREILEAHTHLRMDNEEDREVLVTALKTGLRGSLAELTEALLAVLPESRVPGTEGTG